LLLLSAKNAPEPSIPGSGTIAVIPPFASQVRAASQRATKRFIIVTLIVSAKLASYPSRDAPPSCISGVSLQMAQCCPRRD